jgi:hypothetical protein
VLARLLKYPAGTWIDPMQLRTRGAQNRLIRLWVISDRWIMGPALHLLTGVGAAVDENGHDARSTWLSVSTPDLVQWSFGSSCLSERLGRNERHCRKQGAPG